MSDEASHLQNKLPRPAVDPLMDHVGKEARVQSPLSQNNLEDPDAMNDDMEKYIEENRDDFMATEAEMYSYADEYDRDSKAFESRQLNLAKENPYEPSALAKSLVQTDKKEDPAEKFGNSTKRLASALADDSMGSLSAMETQMINWSRRLTPESQAKVQAMVVEIVNSTSSSPERVDAVAKFIKEGPSLPTVVAGMQPSAAASSSNAFAGDG